MKRKWSSIVGGGLFGFAIIEALTLIIITSEHAPTIRDFIFIIVGIITASTFLGGIIVGVIDQEDAFAHGAYAAVIALIITIIFNLAIGLSGVFPVLYTLSLLYYLFVFLTLLIPIFFGGIGGKLGSLLRGGG